MGDKKRVCDVPFTERYSQEDLVALNTAFKDHFKAYEFWHYIDMVTCNGKGKYEGKYGVEYDKYLRSTLNYEILKICTYDIDLQTRQFGCYEILIHVTHGKKGKNENHNSR